MSDEAPPASSFRAAIVALERSSDPTGASLGEKTPLARALCWDLLEVLYMYAACVRGCPGKGDHTFRYLAGRVTNLGCCGVRQAEGGWYDGSLLTCRVVIEHALLLQLLVRDRNALNTFKAGDGREKRDKLAPRKVRSALTRLGFNVGPFQRRFELLSEWLIHPDLDALARTHSPERLIVGPVLQPAGVMLAMNESAVALGLVVVALLRVPDIDPMDRQHMVDILDSMDHRLGNVLIDHLPPGLVVRLPDDRWSAK